MMQIKIQINNVTFSLDPQYDFVTQLIPSKFDQQVSIINQMFFVDKKATKLLIDAALKDDCANNVAMVYFLSMALQSYGELEKAKKIITQIYQDHPSNLLARCAYANHLIFNDKIDEIPAVFNHTFDLEKNCTERELPLIIFVQFMEIACIYSIAKNEPRNFMKYFSYLMEAAPEHDTTQGLLKNLMEVTGRA